MIMKYLKHKFKSIMKVGITKPNLYAYLKSSHFPNNIPSIGSVMQIFTDIF